jgi:WD40 repeat protein
MSIAFSPDGTQVVSGSKDKNIRLWDAITGTCLNTLKGHSGLVILVVFSPDGTRIVSGSRTSTLQLWDTVTGANLITLQGYYLCSSISFSPDNTRLVFVSCDLTLEMLDTVNGVHLDTLRVENPSVVYSQNIADSVACSLDAKHSSFSDSIARHVALCEAAQCLDYIVDVDGWLCSIYPLQRIRWVPVSCGRGMLAFSGNIIALGTDDGRVVILDLRQLDRICN